MPVLVSGAPGSGKTTLATRLAPALGFALLSKDTIKETLADALGARDAVDLDESHRLGGAAMELLWRLARDSPRVVLEANFRPHSAYERERIAALGGPVVEVNCVCPPEVARSRFAERARSGSHHAVHVLDELPDALLAEYDRPVGIGTVITVDTTAPVDVGALARRVERAIRAAAG
jgi:predicted kinase